MKFDLLETALKESWDKDTCYPKNIGDWSKDNPSFGQCADTALVVQDFLGGILLYCKHHHHYWNLLANNKEIDFTKNQFPKGTNICMDEVHSRNYILTCKGAEDAKTLQRYELLKKRVEEKLGSINNQ